MENLFANVLTETEQKLLHEQTISENTPGTIVRDFQVLIDLLESTKIEVSSVHQLLPMKILPELNSRVSHQTDIQSKRPVQKSYPYIHGLYLLLRASAICYIQTKGKKQFLVLDEIARQSWLTLNPTERYFNLLETWIVWSNQDIIGERTNYRGVLRDCTFFWNSIPKEGLKYSRYQEQHLVGFLLGYHHLALLDLFGFLEIQHGYSQPGKEWRIAGVKRLPFGDAMIKLLASIENQALERLYEDEQETGDDEPDEFEDGIKFGILQPHIKTFFPEWENNLVLSELEFYDGIYLFKVSLSNYIWRRISIPASFDLSEFADVILESYNFDFEHMYEFTYKDRYGSILKFGSPDLREVYNAEDYLIGGLCLQIGINITYLYDFGDRWKFNIILEKINPPNETITTAEILESFGEAPVQYPYYEGEDDWEEEELTP